MRNLIVFAFALAFFAASGGEGVSQTTPRIDKVESAVQVNDASSIALYGVHYAYNLDVNYTIDPNYTDYYILKVTVYAGYPGDQSNAVYSTAYTDDSFDFTGPGPYQYFAEAQVPLPIGIEGYYYVKYDYVNYLHQVNPDYPGGIYSFPFYVDKNLTLYFEPFQAPTNNSPPGPRAIILFSNGGRLISGLFTIPPGISPNYLPYDHLEIVSCSTPYASGDSYIVPGHYAYDQDIQNAGLNYAFCAYLPEIAEPQTIIGPDGTAYEAEFSYLSLYNVDAYGARYSPYPANTYDNYLGSARGVTGGAGPPVQPAAKRPPSSSPTPRLDPPGNNKPAAVNPSKKADLTNQIKRKRQKFAR